MAAAAAAGPPPYLEVAVGLAAAAAVGRAVLDLRQLAAISRPAPPPALAGEVCGEKYAKIRGYSLDKWRFGFLRRTYRLGETLILLGSGALPALWSAAGAAPGARGSDARRGATFAVLVGGGAAALELPWSCFRTFVLEQRHGFNNTTRAVFVADLLKRAALALLLVPLLAAAAAAALRGGGPWAPLLLWAVGAAAAAAAAWAHPLLVAPLFNSFEPLPQCSLRGAVEQLARRLHFPLAQVYRVDGSRRTAHSNAYIYGFGGCQRVVLSDTLLETCTEEEVAAVVAREFGHHLLRHGRAAFALGQAGLLAQAAIFAAVRGSPGLYESFGFYEAQPALVALLLSAILGAPLRQISRAARNLLSHRHELAADAFAVSLDYGDALRSALLHLQDRSRGPLHADPLHSAACDASPPLTARLAAIDGAVRGGAAGRHGKED
ncbi:MAG: peptidase family M48-domain-containing protein [Monoraphidium minutum]|nr:MAG: peptidase family M48-domain-containing protein [Monoraphidium minutum]